VKIKTSLQPGKRVTIILSLLLLLVFSAKSQQHTLKALVLDTVARQALPFVTITILTARDSILYISKTTDAAGKISIANLENGDYLLLFNKKGYEDGHHRFTFTAASPSDTDLKILYMHPKVKVLNEVVISSRKIGAMHLKGDTVVFAADSFKVTSNARVEELLKKLPTLKVERDGKILAEGEEVKKVLVDGEEFFGNDPTLVTRNLRADMVKNVQLYNQQSNEARLSGIKNGVGDKVLNVNLKKDKNKGQFGKTELGAGSEKLYEAQFMYNLFRDKEKFAAFAIASNNGLTSLGLQNESQFGDENTFQPNDLNTWNGKYNGEGIPTLQTAGLHYNHKWGEDKYLVNMNYKLNNLSIDGSNRNTTQFFLPENFNTNYSTKDFINKNISNRFDAKFEAQLNTSTTLSIYTDLSAENQESFSQFDSKSLNQSNTPLYQNFRTVNSKGKELDFHNLFLIKKKLGSAGSSLLWSIEQSHFHNYTAGSIISSSTFYDLATNRANSMSRSAEMKDYSSVFNSVLSRLSYSLPVSTAVSIYSRYSLGYDSKLADTKTTNLPYETFTEPDTRLSSRFRFPLLHNLGTIGFTWNKENLSLQVQQDAGTWKIDNKDFSIQHSVIHKHYNYLSSSLNLRYTFKTDERLSVSYAGQPGSPTINQLQPILNNNDPSNLYLGNPNLDPEFKHNFNLLLKKFNPLKEETFLVNGSYQITDHPITINVSTDSAGRNVFTYDNLKNKTRSSLTSYFIYGRKVKGFLSRFSINGGASASRYVNLTNSIMTQSNLTTYTFGFGLFKNKPAQFEFSLNSTYSYNKNKITTVELQVSDFYTILISPEADVYLPYQIQLHTDLNYNFQQRSLAYGENFKQAIINSSISKRFLKEDRLNIKIAVNDLLNQNSGFTRSTYNNTLTQNEFNTFKRNILLTATYDFYKF
jgi:hypothetical protein